MSATSGNEPLCPCGSGKPFSRCHGKLLQKPDYRPAILDGFTFFNEFEILRFRLELLWDVVDKFIIVEADRTHSGEKKPFNFPQAADTFAKYKSKILFHPIHLNVGGLDLAQRPAAYDVKTAHWRLENEQRNAITDACKDYDFFDILMISDVDEIPDPEILKQLFSDREVCRGVMRRLPISLQNHFFYYSLKHLRNEIWYGTVVSLVGACRLRSAQWHRDNRQSFPAIRNAGWHLSYFGGAERIRRKIESFAHQEYNSDRYKAEEHVAKCIESGFDLYGRPVGTTETSESFLPQYVLRAMEFNKEFFW